MADTDGSQRTVVFFFGFNLHLFGDEELQGSSQSDVKVQENKMDSDNTHAGTDELNDNADNNKTVFILVTLAVLNMLCCILTKTSSTSVLEGSFEPHKQHQAANC